MQLSDLIIHVSMNVNTNQPWEPKARFSGAAKMVMGVLYPNAQRLVYTVVFAECDIEVALRHLLNI